MKQLKEFIGFNLFCLAIILVACAAYMMVGAMLDADNVTLQIFNVILSIWLSYRFAKLLHKHFQK